ncbi:hypothetical protein ACFQV2_31725 [Actinokineospora soli]|uniref:Multiple sugar transport system permease protein n=1 Tax=Actinokineospora soli TaxID=1048753 RepID=A0ABW2TTY2_9PSEU
MTSKVRVWLPYLGIAAIVLYCLSPFYWMLVSSLRRQSDLFSGTPLPNPVSLENYEAAFAPRTASSGRWATASWWRA